MPGIMEMASQLPQLLAISEVVFYVVFILFFGSISAAFYRSYARRIFKFIIRIGLGFAALLASVQLSALFPQFGAGLLGVMQADIFLGGLVASIILGIGLFLVTYGRENINLIDNAIESLKERKERANKIKGINITLIIGLIIIAGILIYSLISYQGLPSTADDLYSNLGINESDFMNIASMGDGMNEQAQQMAKNCVIEGEFIKCPLDMAISR